MSSPGAPISAVFLLEISDYSGSLPAGWLEQGNRTKAIVVPPLHPEQALQPKGGLNLHPMLLPHYHGPHPLRRMAADQQQDAFGGVTLHKMTARFDEGDILGQAPVGLKAWVSRQALVKAHSEAMRIVVSEFATSYCRGELTGTPQPDGDFTCAALVAGFREES